jgi:hypothetical protein
MAPRKDRPMTSTDTLRRYAIVRVEFPAETGDHNASKLADQLVEFAGALGPVYLVDEGVAPATEGEAR